MSPIVKKILKSAARIAAVLAGLFVIYLGVCVVYLYMFTKTMPPEPTSQLDARVAEFRAAAGQVNTSMDDYAVLQALVSEIVAEPTPDTDKIVKRGCPSFDVAELKAHEAEFRKFDPFAERLRPLLAKGLVFGPDYKTPLINTGSLRSSLTYAEVAEAVLDAEVGRSNTAVSGLVLLFQLAGDQQDSAQLIGNMLGISVEGLADIPIVFLTPKFSEADINQLRQEIGNLPDIRRNLVRTLKMQFVRQMDCIDYVRQNPPASQEERQKATGSDCSAETQDWWLRLKQKPSFFDRERYVVISQEAGIIDEM